VGIGEVRVRLLPIVCVGAFGILIGLGCTTLRQVVGYEDQEIQSQKLSRIDGKITTEGPVEGVLVVVLGRFVEGESTAVGVDSYVREKSGSYAFAVSPGRFQVGAYEDRNENGLLDLDERAVRVSDGEVLTLGIGERKKFDIHLQVGAVLKELTKPIDVLAIIKRTPDEQREFSLWAFSVQGEICEDLSDAKFGSSSGPKGLWEPMNFLNDELAGIYFLEAYDPSRIPVLFVHGISGYPQEFTALIAGLNREKYQAWFYFYPSGFALEGISTHLQELLTRMRTRHRFKRMAIVAHSMGGLVSRGAILKYAAETNRDDIRSFISIATPWDGDVSAAGAEGLPIELPVSFNDMDPSSEYLRSLFFEGATNEIAKTLPASVDYHMMLAFKMRESSDIANDGKVSLTSQARAEAQSEAQTVRAWDYDHWSILSSPEAVARMNLLLDRRFD
jgi:pimeloyl-ACP methyl ester carboxylesterase